MEKKLTKHGTSMTAGGKNGRKTARLGRKLEEERVRWHAEARRVKEGKACGSKQARQAKRFVVLIFFALKPTETAEEQVPETRHALKLHLHTH